MSLNVAILGVGAVGQVCATEVVKREYLAHLVLADIYTAGAEAVAKKLAETTAAPITVVQADASSVESVAAILQDVDVVVYAGLPEYNPQVMEACVQTKTNYIDLAADGPGAHQLLEQLACNETFKRAGILGILGMGCDPGFSNVAARYAADQMDTVKTITVLDGDKSTVDYDGFCTYFSPQTAIKECLSLPNYWTPEGGDQYFSEHLPNKELIEFPAPIGWLECYNVEHEEPTTLGPSIGKGVEYVEFKYAMPQELVATLRTLKYLGIDEEKPVEIGGAQVNPLDVIVKMMPKPADLAGKIRGHSCIGTLVKGTKGDRNVEMFVYSMVTHEEAYEKAGSQATVWQTGIPPIVALDMMAEGLLNTTGCIPPEMIDPVPFLERLRARGMRWDVIQKISPIDVLA